MAIQDKLPVATSRYLNSYDLIYNRVKNTPGFTESGWKMAANEGTLDTYASALIKTEHMDPIEFNKKYNLNNATDKTMISALYNEAFADRFNVNQARKRNAYNEDGTPKVDETGKQLIEEFVASDYEYNLDLIRTQNDYNEVINIQNVQREIHNSQSVWENIAGGILGVGTGLVTGAMRGVDNMSAFAGGVIDWIGSGFDSDKYVESTASTDWRPFENNNVIQSVAEFERRYTSIYDYDGNYTSWGKYIGGISSSVGEMLPSMALGHGIGKIGSAAGMSAKAAGKAASIASQSSFYAGMTAGNVRDAYQQFEANGASVDSASILANAAIKSTLQWGIERMLGKIGGSTSLDNMVFGTAQKSIAGKTLSSRAWKTFGKDVLQEGLEEVMQDTSDFLVNEAYGVYVDNDFHGMSDISFQSLFDAFVMGCFTSLGGSAISVLKTKNIVFANDVKLGKLQSWQYGLDVQSFIKNSENIMGLITKDKGLDVDTGKWDRRVLKGELSQDDRVAVNLAVQETYAAYRVLTSIYENIGDERFKAANEILANITHDIDSGKFDSKSIESYVDDMKKQFEDIQTDMKASKSGRLAGRYLSKILKKMREKDVTEIKGKATKNTKGEVNIDESIGDNAKKKIDELLGVDGVKSVIVTDGNIVEGITKDDILISESILDKESVNQILKTVTQNKVISDVTEIVMSENLTDVLIKYYENYSGESNADISKVVTALLFDTEFFYSTLFTGNKDIYKILSYFVKLESDVPGKLRKEIYQNGVNKIIDNWIKMLAEYASIHLEADPETFLVFVKDNSLRDEVRKRIRRNRYAADLYVRIIYEGSKSLSPNEKTLLRSRIDRVYNKDQAESVWNKIMSDDSKMRKAGINDLNKRNQFIYNHGYDGETYMEDVSIPNRVFNKYLKSLGLTLKSLLSKDSLTDSDLKYITDTYKEINEKTILQFRQEQFSRLTDGYYQFSLSDKGEIAITVKGKIVGYSKYRKLQKDIESFKLYDTSVSSTYERHNEIANLIKPELSMGSYYTIDDVINDMNLLRDNVKNDIIKFAENKYGVKLTAANSDYALLYFKKYFVDKYKTITIVMRNDGSFTFADTKNVQKLFKSKDVKITKDSKLTDIFEPDVIPEGLKLVIVKNSSEAKFVSTKTEDNVTIIDNTIYIGENIFNGSQNEIRYVFGHEFQHALQFANNLNLGADFRWLTYADAKTQKKIIGDVRRHKPELFRGIKRDSTAEFNIVQDYVYHSTGESTAYGLEGNEILDFVPILTKRDGKTLSIHFPWGSSHKMVLGSSSSCSFIKAISEKGRSLQSLINGEIEDFLNIPEDIIDDSLITSDDVEIEDKHRKDLWQLYFDRFNDLYEKDVYDWVHSGLSKKETLERISAELRNVSMDLFKVVYAYDIPQDELMEMEIPFIRYQSNDVLENDYFVSISCISGVPSIFHHLYEANVENGYLIIGTFKLKDALLYIGEAESEILIEPKFIHENSIIYPILEVVKSNDLYGYEDIILGTGKRLQFVENYDRYPGVTTSLELKYGSSAKIPNGVRKPNKNELAEDDPRAKDFVVSGSPQNKSYKARYYVLNDDGTQRLTKDGKPVYHYVYDEKRKRKYVGKDKWKDTNLEHFKKKYTPLLMSPQMQKFVLNAKDLDPYLQNRINGNKAGTLTESDIMSYIRSQDNIDDVTFKQINDAFFQNDNIKTFSDLKDLVDKSSIAWSIYRLVNKFPKELKQLLPLLDAKGADPSFIAEVIEKSELKQIIEYYGHYYDRWDTFINRSLEIDDGYSRMSYLRYYDGTIRSSHGIGSLVRSISIRNQKATSKDARIEVQEAFDEASEILPVNKDEIISTIVKRELYRRMGEAKAEVAKHPELSLNSMYQQILDYQEELESKLSSMSVKALKQAYVDEGGLDKILMEGIIAQVTDSFVEVPEIVVKTTSREIMSRIRGHINTIKRNLNPKQIKALVNEFNDIFEAGLKIKRSLYANEIKNKNTEGIHYRVKDPSELQELFDKIVDIKNMVLGEVKEAKQIKNRIDDEKKELKRKIRELERENESLKKGETKVPKVVEFVTEDGTAEVEIGKEIPYSLMKFLRVHYNRTNKRSVKNISGDNDRYIQMIGKDFYEQNAKLFDDLTQSEIDEIIDFYLKTDVPFNDATAPYRTAEIWILTYLVECGRNGGKNFVVSSDQLEKITKHLQQRISRAGTDLGVWRKALKRLNPVKTVAESMARSIGVEVNETDIEELLKVINTVDLKTEEGIKKVENVKKDIYDKLLKKHREKTKDRKKLDRILDKILQYEGLAMLSGPGTWLRNQVSDYVVEGSNKLADGMGGKLDKILGKIFPKSQKIHNQYQMVGTKVTDEVANYIRQNLIDNGLLDMTIDYVSKYDPRNGHKNADEKTMIAQMIGEAIVSNINRNNLSDNKVISAVEKFIRKMISDDKFVKKAALRYLGKMITEDLNNGRIKSKTEFLSQNGLSKQFMTYMAEAFKLASYDYMHKPNILSHLESQLARANNKAYFAYKQVFPFMGASYNWFVEGLKYTPLGLTKAIINYAKLEKTVAKMDENRRTFKYGDIGISSDFAKYITLRDVGKGVIGSVGMGIGILLMAFGVAQLDEEDEKYKIVIGDVSADISDIFGTQGIFLGMALASDDNFSDIAVAALDQMFMDSSLSSFFNTFRYSQSVGDWIAYQPYSMLNMMIPNFVKTVSSLVTPYEVNYSDGILGKLERLAVNAIPGVSYAFPHYYDPYTGEKQIPEKLWLLTKSVDKLTPIGLSVYNVSDLEKLAIEYGVHKSQLTGHYTVNDERVNLSSSKRESLNKKYGELNVKSFKQMKSGKIKYKIKQANGTYKEITWNRATDAEKAAIVDRIMTDNSGYAKIYILTQSGYKYYASESEYKTLKSLGITKNVYKENKKQSGFVKVS